MDKGRLYVLKTHITTSAKGTFTNVLKVKPLHPQRITVL